MPVARCNGKNPVPEKIKVRSLGSKNYFIMKANLKKPLESYCINPALLYILYPAQIDSDTVVAVCFWNVCGLWDAFKSKFIPLSETKSWKDLTELIHSIASALRISSSQWKLQHPAPPPRPRPRWATRIFSFILFLSNTQDVHIAIPSHPVSKLQRLLLAQ